MLASDGFGLECKSLQIMALVYQAAVYHAVFA